MEENKQTCFDENEYRGIKRGQAVKDAVDKVKKNSLVKGCGDVIKSTFRGYKVVGKTFFENLFSWIGTLIFIIFWPVKWVLFLICFIPTGLRRSYDYDCHESPSSGFKFFSMVFEKAADCVSCTIVPFAVFSFYTWVGLTLWLFMSQPLWHALAFVGGTIFLNITSLAYEIGRLKKGSVNSDKNEVA